MTLGSAYMKILATEFENVRNGSITFERARDITRAAIKSSHPAEFSTGPNGTDIFRLLPKMCGQKVRATRAKVCPSCSYEIDIISSVCTYTDVMHRTLLDDADHNTIGGLFHVGDVVVPTSERTCPRCQELTQTHTMVEKVRITSIPPLLVAGLNNSSSLIRPHIKVPFDGKIYTLRLRGIIYGGGYHFTAKIIDVDGTIWYHDGQVTASSCRREGSLHHTADLEDLRYSGREPVRKIAVALVYARN